MAKLECKLHGDFDTILKTVEEAVFKSVSATKEDSSYFVTPNCRCAVNVYERYSYLGNNRVSLNITLLEADGQIFFSAVTSGGSQAVFFKVNTWGEENFLDTIRDTVSRFM